MDRVEIETNKYLESEAKKSEMYLMLLDEIDDKLVELDKLKDEIINIAKDYKGYDFSEDVEEVI